MQGNTTESPYFELFQKGWGIRPSLYGKVEYSALIGKPPDHRRTAYVPFPARHAAENTTRRLGRVRKAEKAEAVPKRAVIGGLASDRVYTWTGVSENVGTGSARTSQQSSRCVGSHSG